MAQAVPSYGPQRAGLYVKKLECFCFTQQALDGGESQRMPVRFLLERDLPREVTTLTLSYAFFNMDSARADPSAGTAVALQR